MSEESGTGTAPGRQRRGGIRSPRELAAGLILAALAAGVLAATAGLETGTLRSMGPGMMPRAVAVLVGVAGLALAGLSLRGRGADLGRWPVRGPIFVCLAIAAFALTIRTVGLALAGPAVVIVSGLGSPEVRPKELVVFAVVITAFCIGLFRYALGLPIPVLLLPGVTI